MKEVIKRNFPKLVALKRRVQFALVFIMREMDALVTMRRVDSNAKKIAKLERVRVAFLIVSPAEFQMEGVFRLMLQSKRYEPFIVVIPFENWKGIDARADVAKQVAILSKQYGDKVKSPYVGDGYLDIVGLCDLCITANTYDRLTNERYRIRNLARRGLPVILSNYFYYHGSTYSEKSLSRQDALSFVWRYYAENERWQRKIEENHPILRWRHGVKLSGVPKVDLLNDVKEVPRSRKRVLLCPHHSIRPNILPNYGNFDRYADLFLKLPKRYPEIDWVFRPHPLLQSTLEANGIWPKGKWEAYVDEFCSTPNAKYIPSGSYWDLFVNSDGMIQDCGSFLAEYHCSGHPQCYIIQSEAHIKTQLNDWGLELLSHTYAAASEKEILDFIDRVIVEGVDSKGESRRRFVHERMLPNYPHVNEWIFNDIKEALGK